MGNVITNNIQAARYKVVGRAYWVAHYTSRDDVHEWDCDWIELPRDGLVEVSLHCPNGQVGVLGKRTAGMGDRFFQFKTAVRGAMNGTTAHVIGFRVDGTDQADMFVWDYLQGILFGPFRDSLESMQYGGGETKHLNYDVLGVRT